MEKLVLKVGNDNGNSEQKMVINETLIKQPNVYTRVNKLPNLDELNDKYIVKNIHDNLIITIESSSINNGVATTYFVGTYATKSGRNIRNIEVGAVNSKLNSEVPLINTLAQIAAYATKESYLKDNKIGNIEVAVDMTTGLPVNQYNKENARIFADRFIGDHKVTVFLGNKKVEVKLNFEYVKVLPEGTSTVFYLQNNKIKELEKYDFKNKRIQHVDIGEGTTEYPMTSDINFNPLFITGSNNGVGHAINNVLLDFMKQKSLQKYTRQDFSNALRNKNHKYNADAEEIIEDELEDQAFAIADFTKQEIAKANNDIDYVLVYGGGSILMRDYLERELKQYLTNTGVELLYVPEGIAVEIEVLGMYEFCNSKIFASLKEKYVRKDA